MHARCVAPDAHMTRSHHVVHMMWFDPVAHASTRVHLNALLNTRSPNALFIDAPKLHQHLPSQPFRNAINWHTMQCATQRTEPTLNSQICSRRRDANLCRHFKHLLRAWARHSITLQTRRHYAAQPRTLPCKRLLLKRQLPWITRCALGTRVRFVCTSKFALKALHWETASYIRTPSDQISCDGSAKVH